ncbi:MAG: FAD/NAD(P)-binding oxidoreductase [Halioglobus sp.]
MTINRRNFVKATGVVAAVSSAPGLLHAQTTKPRVIVVGGGFGGATAAKYLKHWGGDSLNVTMIDPKVKHTSCVMSGLVLNKRLSLADLRFDYGALAGLGVEVLRDTVKNIDPDTRTLTLKAGASQQYDMLILAAGISFKRPSGWDSNAMPHAWIAGGQTNLLKRKLAGMEAGQTFVMTIPPSPYRCPPGPYERACVVADILKRRGGGTVKILDANDKIQSERETFGRAFTDLYRDIVEYYPSATLNGIDGDILDTSIGPISGDVVNIIPTQRAGGLVRRQGLAVGSPGKSWAPVDVTTYESTVQGFADVHIIGDSQGSSQPKSAHMANAQAKVCADAILRKLSSRPTDNADRLKNLTTNSACYSPVTYDTATWLTAVYHYDMASQQMKPSHVGEAGEWTRDNYDDMFDWSDNLFADTFGPAT